MNRMGKLTAEVASILWNEWDPIGVNDGENPWDDEYESYVPQVVQCVLDGADDTRLAALLSSFITQGMAMSTHCPDHDLKVARKILKTKHHIWELANIVADR